jgi:hypothetical protein
MKALIVICVIVLVLQVATLGVSLSGGSGSNPPTSDQIKSGQEPKASEFPITARFEGLLDPLRPRIKLPWAEKSFHASVESVQFEGGADQRLAKFELTGGSGARIAYDCTALGKDCPKDQQTQTVCLCPPKAALPPDFVALCKPRDAVCAENGNVGAITVYAKTGTLQFSGIGPAGGTVRQR